MPFTPNVASSTNHFPTPAPGDIEIRFTGLLLLFPTSNGAGGTNCKIGALQAPRHSVKIKVIDKETLDEIQPPAGMGSIIFPITISTGGAGVTKWVSTTTPFPGEDDPDIDKQRDFRW